RPQVHILIVMSHLGLPNDERMARGIPEIDCIVGGHTHHLLDTPIRIGNTYICAAGKFGQFVGAAEMEFDLSVGRISRFDGRCVSVHDMPNDEQVVELIEQYRTRSRITLSKEVAKLHVPLENRWDQESELGNLLASGIRTWTETDI